MSTDPHTRRVALVIDIDTAIHTTALDRTARRWLHKLVEDLADHDITAVPVRIDIDSWPSLYP